MVGDSQCYDGLDTIEVDNCIGEDYAHSLAFRPRGSLARALYEKQRTDDFLSHFDKTKVRFFSFFNIFNSDQLLNLISFGLYMIV